MTMLMVNFSYLIHLKSSQIFCQLAVHPATPSDRVPEITSVEPSRYAAEKSKSVYKRAPQGFAPIAIGLCLTLIHLISIPVTNTSVNPARSTGVALFAGDWAIAQVWLFWVAPIIGGMLGAAIYRFIGSEKE